MNPESKEGTLCLNTLNLKFFVRLDLLSHESRKPKFIPGPSGLRSHKIVHA